MSTKTTKKKRKALLIGVALAWALLLSAPAVLSATSASTTVALTAPVIPGVAALPGPVAAPATPAANMGVLKTTPDIGLPGTRFTITGSGLPTGKDVNLVWATANVTWVVDARPDSVDYLGRKADKFSVVLGTAKTD